MVSSINSSNATSSDGTNVWAARREKWSPLEVEEAYNGGAVTVTVTQQIVTRSLEELSRQASRMGAFGKGSCDKAQQVCEIARNNIVQILQAGPGFSRSAGQTQPSTSGSSRGEITSTSMSLSK